MDPISGGNLRLDQTGLNCYNVHNAGQGRPIG